MLNKKMRLSKNFTLEEMVATSHKGLQDAIGRPVYINSGYRSKRLNARVGGVPNSRHLQGKAADIHCDNLDYAKVIFDILRQNKYVAYTYIGRASPPAPPLQGGGRYWVHVQM